MSLITATTTVAICDSCGKVASASATEGETSAFATLYARGWRLVSATDSLGADAICPACVPVVASFAAALQETPELVS